MVHDDNMVDCRFLLNTNKFRQMVCLIDFICQPLPIGIRISKLLVNLYIYFKNFNRNLKSSKIIHLIPIGIFKHFLRETVQITEIT